MSDIVFRNGTVFSGTAFLPAGTEVRVADGKIAEVGIGLDCSASNVVDLHGETLLPGFVDAHVHPIFAGNQLRHCDLRNSDTVAQYVETISRYAESHPEEKWITGGGWSTAAFTDGMPRRQVLDAVVPDRPIYLANTDGHSAWVNSAALRLAGIDAHTPDPPDGHIERELGGSPSGTLQEGAAHAVGRFLPETSVADWYESLQLAQEYLLARGITGWQDAIVGDYLDGSDPLDTYLAAAGDGTLQVNVVGALWWDRNRGLEQLPELLERRRVGQSGRFHANTVKIMLDGVVETHTAAMLEPYLDHAGCTSTNSGIDFIEAHELRHYVSALDAEGFQIHFHALGDRAVRNALDAIEAAQRLNGRSGHRHHLAHLQVVHPDDIERFARLGATANIQALWATHEPEMDEFTIPYLGARRTGWQYPFRSLHDSGAQLCAGSDWPVSSPDPLAAVHVAVNRSAPVRPGATATEPFLPEQAIDRETALTAYTSGSAVINGLGASVGTICEGFDADLAIVDADLKHIDQCDIGNARVTQTWVRGDLLYDGG